MMTAVTWARRAAVLTAFLAVVSSPAAGQAVPWSVGAGAEVQRFNFSDSESAGIKALTLFTVPVAADVTLGQRVTMRLAGFYASGSLEDRSGTTSSISGLTDTDLSATVSLADGSAAITAVAALPTGNSTHTLEEANVAGLVASDLLPFRISNWGSGGGFGVRALGARSFGRVGAGLSIGYFVAGDFSPVAEDQLVYRPGSTLQVRAAIDGNVGRAGKASLEISFQTFGEDVAEDINLYQSGNRFQAIGSYAFAAGRRSSAVVYLGAMHRASGEFDPSINAPFTAGPQTLFMAGAGGRLRVGGTLVLPTLDLRALRSDDGIDQGFDSRLGVAAEFRTAGGWAFVPLARVHLGRIQVVEGVESSFVGVDLGLTVRVGRFGL
jgi:hypothetical protein